MTDDRKNVFAAIRMELNKAAESLLHHLQTNHSNEHIYAFFFVLPREGFYALATAGTEEALTRTATVYESKGYGAKTGNTIDLLRVNLRWTDPEDGWYGLRDSYCDDVNNLIDSACKGGLIEYFDGSVEQLCLETLKDLDSKGAFGTIQEREKIVLGLAYGDQSDEQSQLWAKQVNPPSVYERYCAEMNTGRAAEELLINPPYRRSNQVG